MACVASKRQRTSGGGTLSSGSNISKGSGSYDSHGRAGATEAQKGTEVHTSSGQELGLCWMSGSQACAGIGQDVKEVQTGQGGKSPGLWA